MYFEWKEGRDLIEWMRHYNQFHDNKLQYFGVHIGGFSQNWKIPMDQIFHQQMLSIQEHWQDNDSEKYFCPKIVMSP